MLAIEIELQSMNGTPDHAQVTARAGRKYMGRLGTAIAERAQFPGAVAQYLWALEPQIGRKKISAVRNLRGVADNLP